MPDHTHSLVALRYSGEMSAREALFSLERLRHEGSIQLRDAAVIYKDNLGSISVYRSGELTRGQHTALSGLMGLALGLIVGRPAKILVGGAILGGFLSTLRTQRRNKPLLELSKNLAPDQSALYMLIIDASWPVVKQRMAPFWEEGSVLLNQPLPAHNAALADLLVDKPHSTDSARKEEEQGQIAKGKSELSKSASQESAAGHTQEVDFTQIRGIGPAIHQRLIENDVRTYAQLATMSIPEVADLADVPPSLLIRYDIITQARQLAEGGE